MGAERGTVCMCVLAGLCASFSVKALAARAGLRCHDCTVSLLGFSNDQLLHTAYVLMFGLFPPPCFPLQRYVGIASIAQ